MALNIRYLAKFSNMHVTSVEFQFKKLNTRYRDRKLRPDIVLLVFDFQPSKLKLLLVFFGLACKFILSSYLHANPCLIFGLTRRQLTAALSTSDFSTTDMVGVSIDESSFSD